MANPLLGWETSQSYNLGLDFTLFNNRLSGNIDLYSTKTTDLLLEVSIPSMTGYDKYLTNIGETQNRGIEVTLNSENINTKDFSWSTSLNFSANANKILHLSGEDLDGDGKEDDDIVVLSDILWDQTIIMFLMGYGRKGMIFLLTNLLNRAI